MHTETEGRYEEHVHISNLDEELLGVRQEVEGRYPQDEVGHAHHQGEEVAEGADHIPVVPLPYDEVVAPDFKDVCPGLDLRGFGIQIKVYVYIGGCAIGLTLITASKIEKYGKGRNSHSGIESRNTLLEMRPCSSKVPNLNFPPYFIPRSILPTTVLCATVCG